MEFLRDGSIDKAESARETPKDIAIIDSGGERGSNPVDATSAFDIAFDLSNEFETPKACRDHQGKVKNGTYGKWLDWLKVIGKQRVCFRCEARP